MSDESQRADAMNAAPASEDSSAPRPSGLRNPTAAVRGVGAAALATEALVLLLAIQPIRVLGGHLTGPAVGTILALVVVCALLCGLLRRPWSWYAAAVPQLVLIGVGFVFHLALTVLGVVFGLVWLYVLNVRRTVLSSPSRRPDPVGDATR